MKVTKRYCDICGKEILDDIGQMVINYRDTSKVQHTTQLPEDVRLSDICVKCYEEILSLITNLKEAAQSNPEDKWNILGKELPKSFPPQD